MNDVSAEQLLAKARHDAQAKAIVKEAIEEWLDDKFRAFGKWTFIGVAAAAFGFVVRFLVMHGLKVP